MALFFFFHIFFFFFFFFFLEQGQMAQIDSSLPMGHKGPHMGKAMDWRQSKPDGGIAARFTSSSDRVEASKGCVFSKCIVDAITM